MSLSVLVAVHGRSEAALVARLGQSGKLTVVRRCADVAELVSTAAAGLASVALISGDLPMLDRTTLSELADHQVAVVGVYPSGPDSEPHERLLRQLGVSVVIAADADLARIEEAVDSARHGGGLWSQWVDEEVSEPGSVSSGVPGGQSQRTHPQPRVDGEPDEPGPSDSGGESSTPAPVQTPQRAGQVIAVWGPTGAPGRSLVALTIASELAARGKQVVLVDADPYGGVQAQSLALLGEAPGLAAAARASDQGNLDLAELSRLAPEALPGMRILTGLPKAERWPELRAAPVEHVLTLARQLADVIVVDTGFNLEDDEELSYDTLAPRRNAATLTALELADQVVVVGQGDPIGLQRLVRGLQELGSVRAPGQRTILINRVRASAVGPQPEEKIAAAMRRFAGIEDIRVVPDDVPGVDAAMLAGRTLGESSPSSPARLALADVAAELVDLDPVPHVRSRRRLRV